MNHRHQFWPYSNRVSDGCCDVRPDDISPVAPKLEEAQREENPPPSHEHFYRWYRPQMGGLCL